MIRKITDFIRKIWKDPVGSKVIAILIVGILSIGYAKIQSLSVETTFKDEFHALLDIKITVLNIVIGVIILVILYGLVRYLLTHIQFFYSDNKKATDKKLYLKITNDILPSDGSIDFIRNHDFAGSFLHNRLNDLHNYMSIIEKPEFEFFHNKLNNILLELNENISKFVITVAKNTWHIDNPHVEAYTIPPEWQVDMPDRFESTVNKIHSYAETVCTQYDKLVRYGRRRLGD